MQTDVEILKVEMRGLQGSMSEIVAKMDMLIAMQVQIVRLQEQQDTQRQAMDRAFDSIRTNREAVSAVDNSFQRAYSFIKGGALVGTLLLAFVQWYVVDQINTLKQVDVEIKAVDRRMTVIESRLWPDVVGGGK